MWYDGEYTLNVAPLPAPMDEENVNEEENSLYPLITYPTDVIYHKEWIQSGYKAARFLINPFTYHANTQKLGIATSVSLNITIEPVDEDEKIEGPKYPESIKSQVYNPEDIDMETENWTIKNVRQLGISQQIHLQIVNHLFTCISPNATKLEVYTMDAIKVGEAGFANGEASVTVRKTPATYLYIVTYPDGRRESGKVVVKD